VTKNVRNVRFQKDSKEDIYSVRQVEKILKDIIDFGFAENVDEELLEFDDQGTLLK